jgi:hypothetical protein
LLKGHRKPAAHAAEIFDIIRITGPRAHLCRDAVISGFTPHPGPWATVGLPAAHPEGLLMSAPVPATRAGRCDCCSTAYRAGTPIVWDSVVAGWVLAGHRSAGSRR